MKTDHFTDFLKAGSRKSRYMGNAYGWVDSDGQSPRRPSESESEFAKENLHVGATRLPHTSWLIKKQGRCTRKLRKRLMPGISSLQKPRPSLGLMAIDS